MRRYKQPLKQILGATRDYWDLAEIRPAVRKNFEKMTNCRTPALGAEVYASETEQKIVYHIEDMSELWASSHVVVATGAVGCPPRYPIRGPLFYDAGCSVAHLSTEPEPTSGFGRTRGSSDTRMGEGQIWCSPSRSGSHTHVRPPFELFIRISTF